MRARKYLGWRCQLRDTTSIVLGDDSLDRVGEYKHTPTSKHRTQICAVSMSTMCILRDGVLSKSKSRNKSRSRSRKNKKDKIPKRGFFCQLPLSTPPNPKPAIPQF